MYMVAFMYPSSEDRDFDLEYYVNVHLPLGVGLTKKYLDIKPDKIIVYTPFGDSYGGSEGYAAITSIFFDSEEKANKFIGLFKVEEAADRLSADYENYTGNPPQVMKAKVTEIPDIDALIERFKQELDV